MYIYIYTHTYIYIYIYILSIHGDLKLHPDFPFVERIAGVPRGALSGRHPDEAPDTAGPPGGAAAGHLGAALQGRHRGSWEVATGIKNRGKN